MLTHLKSRPGCLEELGISPSSNWAELLGLPTSSSSNSASLPINEHSFHVQPDLKVAAKRPVEYMWKEEESDFPSMPDAPIKRLKHRPNATNGNQSSKITIEHRCGSKQIQMTIDETTAGTLLKNLMADKLSNDSSESKIATVLTEAQIEGIQSLMDPNNEEQSLPDSQLDEEEFTGEAFNPIPEINQVDATNLEEERMFQNAKRFVDRGNGCFTTEELLSIRLLSLMRDIGAPLKTYGKIRSLFKDAITDRVALTTTFRHRHTAIKHFSQRFGMNGLYPTILTQTSPINNRYYPVPVHNAQAMIESLLYSSLAQDESNLLFPNPDNPLDPPPAEVTVIADIDTGRSYRTAYKTLCHRPNHVLCGIIVYIDKLATDRHGHLSLEPVCFTLSIFNQKTRNRPEAWRPLGYVPNIGLMSKAESTHAIKSAAKVQLYHDILSKIFRELASLQTKGGLPFQFFYRGKEYNVILQIPLLAVLGDTESHDRLCGRYNSRGKGVARLCRHCTTPRSQTDNVDYDWEHIIPSQIQNLVDSNNLEALKSISQHPIVNAFYRGICLGGNPRGIHGMTPGEPLHVLEIGLFKIVIEGLCVNLGYKPKSKSYPKILQELDVWARRIGKGLLHQSDRNLPRTYFPNGVTGGTKLAGHEMPGVLLVLLLICKMKETRTLLLTSKYFEASHLRGWVKLLEGLLLWRWWLRLPSVPIAEIQSAKYATRALLKLFRSVVKRKHGSKLLIIKFHLCLHFLENQLDFGVTANVDTGPMESNHKRNAKQPSGQTQRRAETIELQTARRYIDNLIIDKAKSAMNAKYPCTVSPPKTPTLVGAKYTLELHSGDDDDILPDASIVWDKHHRIETSYHPQFLEWLCSNVLAELGPNIPIRGCAEHKRVTTCGKTYMFRAHPSWRGGDSWHDWAIFSWEQDDGTPMHLPAQIITFVEFSEFDIGLLADLPFVFGSNPGLYAMIESIERPLSAPATGNYVVVEGTKELTLDERLQRQVNVIPITASNLCLVPVDTIYEPIAAIPHQGGNSGVFMFIRPSENWGYGFSQMIEEQDPGEIVDDTDSDSNDDNVCSTDETESIKEGEVDKDSEIEESDASDSEDS